MKYAIGVDIGGNKTKYALLRDWKVVSRLSDITPKKKGDLIKVIKDDISKLISFPKSQLIGIGFGIPGPLDKKRRLILNPPNVKALSNVHLSEIMEREFKIRTKMENDVNCFTLAETLMGAAKGFDKVIGLTFGTGIGGGIVIDKKIYIGAFGGAGEFGHMSIKFDGRKCRCGNIGCFEEYASEKFIWRESGVSPKELEEKVKKGNKKAKKIYQDYGQNIGVGVSNLINILDPEVVVLGGGIAKAGSLILKPIKKEVDKRVLLTHSKKSVKIKLSKLSDFAGAVGAALLLK